MSEWIEHDGRECPVTCGTVVQIKIRSGVVSAAEPARSWTWRNIRRSRSHPHDIIAYRIVEEEA